MTFKVYPWRGVFEGEGLALGVPEDVYHADNACPEPSLSASVAKIAFNKCLSKAKATHPRLRDPDFAEDEDESPEARAPTWYMDVGSAVHSLSLKAGMPVVEVRASDWRKKDTQELRAALRAERKIPLLTKHYTKAHRMSARLQPVLESLLGTDFAAEAMACSKDRDYGWWVRSLLDGVSGDLRHVVDLKTTSLDMSPRQAARTFNSNGNCFQAAYYVRNLDNLDPGGMGRRRFDFVFCETTYPHEIAIVHPDEALMTLGDMQVNAARKLWDRAMTSGEWPGYPTESQPIAPENWALREVENRLMMDEELNE